MLATQALIAGHARAVTTDQRHRIPEASATIASPPEAIYGEARAALRHRARPAPALRAVDRSVGADGGTCYWSNTGSGCDTAGEPQPAPVAGVRSPSIRSSSRSAAPLMGLGDARRQSAARSAAASTGGRASRAALRGRRRAESVTPKRGYLAASCSRPSTTRSATRLRRSSAYDAAGKVIGERSPSRRTARALPVRAARKTSATA